MNHFCKGCGCPGATFNDDGGFYWHEDCYKKYKKYRQRGDKIIKIVPIIFFLWAFLFLIIIVLKAI